MKITELQRMNIHRDEIEEVYIYPNEIIIKLKRDSCTVTNKIIVTPDVCLVSNKGNEYNINTTLKCIWERD